MNQQIDSIPRVSFTRRICTFQWKFLFAPRERSIESLIQAWSKINSLIRLSIFRERIRQGIMTIINYSNMGNGRATSKIAAEFTRAPWLRYDLRGRSRCHVRSKEQAGENWAEECSFCRYNRTSCLFSSFQPHFVRANAPWTSFLPARTIKAQQCPLKRAQLKSKAVG